MDESSVVVEVTFWEANGWALAGDGFSCLLKFEAGSVELDFAANLTFDHDTQRKETKLQEYTDVKRLGGISSHHGVSWRAGRSTLEWHSKNAESDDKKHG